MSGFAQLLAGRMGGRANQVAKGISASMAVDPIERLNQKMAGRLEGGAVRKKTKEDRARRSLMSSYGGL